MLPEERLVRRVVGVPIAVLIARQRVQIDDRVDALRRAQVDDAIQVPEPLLLDDERRHVVFEVAIVDRDADQVQPQRLDEASVVLAEEVGQEAVEEERVLLRAERLEQGLALRLLVGRIAGDEVLHVEPAAQAEPAQDHRRAGAVDKLVAADLEEWGGCHGGKASRLVFGCASFYHARRSGAKHRNRKPDARH